MHLLLLLAACASPEVELVDVPPAPDVVEEEPHEEIPDADPVEEHEPTVTREEAPAFDDSDLAGWLFTLDAVHTVELTIPEASQTALGNAPYQWAEADVTIDGEPMESVGVRLRGKIGSYRTLGGKPKFKISFGEFRDGQRFYGLKELSLNNAVVDCSYVKEVVGYRVYEAAGVPMLRTSYARVSVNGADYGLYVLLETPNDRWLAHNYADPTGNLYDGKYVWYGGYSYTLLDFANGVDGLYQLEEGTDVRNADIAAISSTLTSTYGTSEFYARMGEVLDWDNFHRYTAVDQLLGHVDGYSMNTNNYRVYFDPTDGKADLLPWDLDYSFLHDWQWGLSWGSPAGNLTYACWVDANVCKVEHRARVAEVLAAFEAVDWDAFLDEVEALTYTHTQTDPRRECSAADVQPTRDYVRAWLRARPGELRAYWGL